jgi:hypothetical protein
MKQMKWWGYILIGIGALGLLYLLTGNIQGPQETRSAKEQDKFYYNLMPPVTDENMRIRDYIYINGTVSN